MSSHPVIATRRDPQRTTSPPPNTSTSTTIPPRSNTHRLQITQTTSSKETFESYPSISNEFSDSLMGPEDEMNPSHNDTDGCNMLSPLYNMQEVCGVRQRRRTSKFDSEEEYLEDGELPALVSPGRDGAPLSSCYGGGGYGNDNGDAQLGERKKAKQFWSQLELDLDEDEEEEAQAIPVTPSPPKVSKTPTPQPAPRHTPRPRRSTEYVVDNEDEDSGPNPLHELCTMAQSLSQDLLTSICGTSTPKHKHSKNGYGHIYTTHPTATQEQVAIEVEYIQDDDSNQSDGSMEEVDEMEDGCTAVGSFMQLDLEEGEAKTMVTRAKSPTRVVIVNLPRDLEDQDEIPAEKVKATRSPTHHTMDEGDDEEEQEEDDYDYDYDDEHNHPTTLRNDAISVTSSLSKKSRNSKLSQFSRASKKTFQRKFPRTSSPTKTRSDNNINVKEKESPTTPSSLNNNVSASASTSTSPNTSHWSPEKQEQYDELREKGYEPSQALLLVKEIDKYNDTPSNQHQQVMEDIVSDLETSDMEESLSSKRSKSKKSWKMFPSKDDGSTSDTGSVSSSTSSSINKLKNFLTAKKRNKIHRSASSTSISESKELTEEQNAPEYSSSESSSSEEVEGVEAVVVAPTSRSRSKSKRESKSPGGRNKFLNSFRSRSQSKTRSVGSTSTSNSSKPTPSTHTQNNTTARPKSADPSARYSNRHDATSTPSNNNMKTTPKERSMSAPRGGRQPSRTSLLSSRSRPIPGMDDLLKSSLSWDLLTPLDGSENNPSVSPSTSRNNTSKDTIALQSKTKSFDSHDSSIFDDLDGSGGAQDPDVTVEISNVSKKPTTENNQGGKQVASIDDLLASDLDYATTIAPTLSNGTDLNPPSEGQEEEDVVESEEEEEEGIQLHVGYRGRKADTYSNLQTDQPSRSVSTSRGAELRRLRLSGMRDTLKRQTTPALASQIHNHEAAEEEQVEEKDSELEYSKDSSASMLSVSSETPKDNLLELQQSISPIKMEYSYEDSKEASHKDQVEEMDDSTAASQTESLEDDTPYMSVDIDEQSLLSYGSVASPRKQTSTSGKQPDSPSHSTIVSSDSITYADDTTISTQTTSEAPLSVREGTAASRRMERAKKVNPWLREADSQNLLHLQQGHNDASADESSSSPTVPLTSIMKKEEISLKAFLETGNEPNLYGIDRETMSVASTLGARSVLTTATDSTWKRRNGTSRDRLTKVKESRSKDVNKGWLESMKKAAKDGKVPHHTWDPKLGWVVKPGLEDKVKELQTNFDLEQNVIEENDLEMEMEDDNSDSSGDVDESTENVKKSLLSKENHKSDSKRQGFKPIRLKEKSTNGMEKHDSEERKRTLHSHSQRQSVSEDSDPFQSSPIEAHLEKETVSSLPSEKTQTSQQSTSPLAQKKLFEPELMKLHRHPRDRSNKDRRRNFDDASSVISEDTENRLQHYSAYITKEPFLKEHSNGANLKEQETKQPSPQSVVQMELKESPDSVENDVNTSTKELFDTYFAHSVDESEYTGDSRDASSGKENHVVHPSTDEKLPAGTTAVNVVKQKISVEESRLFASSKEIFGDTPDTLTHESTRLNRVARESQKSRASETTLDVSDIHGRGLSRLATLKSKSTKPTSVPVKESMDHANTHSVVSSDSSGSSGTQFLQDQLNSIRTMRSDMKKDPGVSSNVSKRLERLKSTLSKDSDAHTQTLKEKKPLSLKPSSSDTNVRESQIRREKRAKQDVFRSKNSGKSSSRQTERSESRSDAGSRASSVSGISALISKYNVNGENDGSRRKQRRPSSTANSEVSVEEESIFLDALARTYTDDEDYRSDTIAKHVYDQKIPTIAEKVNLGNNLVFEQAEPPVDGHKNMEDSSDIYTSQQDYSIQNTTQESTKWSEVESDTGAANCTGGFFSRMAACNAGIPAMSSPMGTGDLPLSHLAFMMKSSKQSSMDPSAAQESVKEEVPPTPVVFRSMEASPESSITFKKYSAGRKPPLSETSKSMISQSQYLENIAKKAAASGFKSSRNNKDAETSSQVSQKSAKSSSSEAWQAFLAKKKQARIETPKVAEKFAAGKVEEMMAAMSKSSVHGDKKKTASDIIESISNAGSSNISSRDAQRFLVQRDRNNSRLKKARSRSRSASKTRPEYAEAAEKLAAARVEAMMSALSGSGMKKGNEI